jgi:hypothetical protein
LNSQVTAALGTAIAFSIESVSDFVGNTNEDIFSWTFVVAEPPCGQAEFLADFAAGHIVLTSASNLRDGINISIYNPAQASQAWVDNLRIQSIELLYRKVHSPIWIHALDMEGNPAEFYDDVSASGL